MIFAAQIYGFFVLLVILFQVALAAGMPWGNLAMGGKFPGKFPPHMRLMCLVIILLLVFWGAMVFIRAGLLWPQWFAVSHTGIWIVVAFNVLGAVLNLITPSKWERIVWAPVTIVLLICSTWVALA